MFTKPEQKEAGGTINKGSLNKQQLSVLRYGHQKALSTNFNSQPCKKIQVYTDG